MKRRSNKPRSGVSLPAIRQDENAFCRWRLAVPPEKGGWIWWIGPLILGACAARNVNGMVLVVCAGAFAAFCIRQPLTLLARQLRRGQKDRRVALMGWAVVYGTVLAIVASLLWLRGHAPVVGLGLLAVPIFLWHLTLVYIGRDRHQRGLDLSAATALALAGPAAYWAAGGLDPSTAFWVWALPALQSCASIIHMFLRFEERMLHTLPPLRERLKRGRMAMIAHLLVLGAALAAYALGDVSALAVLALAIPAGEGVWSVVDPPTRPTPKELGLRQLFVSSAALFLLALGMVIAP